jgi:hypothetical protein
MVRVVKPPLTPVLKSTVRAFLWLFTVQIAVIVPVPMSAPGCSGT